MFQLLSPRLWLALLWTLLIAVSIFIRPLFPVDETRYAAVAWEMWVRNDFLVPYLNGETYSHKPPLLFWLMQLSWWLLGVNDWSLRIIAPLFSLATLYLSRIVALQLWPDRRRISELTPFILLGFLFWIIYSTLTMFDIMLTFFALCGIYSLLKLIRAGLSFTNLSLFGLAIGGGLLSKGPVILLHVLPVALLAPWWVGPREIYFRWIQWYGGVLFAIILGASIALCWAIPAGISGGEAYRNAIFLGQTSGRLVNSFAHQLPWWWYLQILPLLLLPWPLLKPFWTGLLRLNLQDFGTRFCLAWALPVFIAFSAVSGKRVHYLLPLMPALALLLAQAIDRLTAFDWHRAHVLLMAVLGVLGLALVLLPALNDYYHWREELSSISSLWGLLLLLNAIILATIKANNAQEAVFYCCAASIATLLVISCGFFEITAKRYDTTAPARKIAELMTEKRAIAFYGNKYHGQYHFTGRLTQPITVISNFNDLYSFAREHQSCYILVTYNNSDALPASLMTYHYPFRNRNIGFVSGKTILEHPDLGSVLVP